MKFSPSLDLPATAEATPTILRPSRRRPIKVAMAASKADLLLVSLCSARSFSLMRLNCSMGVDREVWKLVKLCFSLLPMLAETN